MVTWKRAPKEKCPMIPCRTNVSGSHPGTAHLNFDCLVMFHSWCTMQKTLTYSEPFELDSSLNFSLSIPIKCVTWKDLRLGDDEGKCQRNSHTPFLSTLDSVYLGLFQGARHI